MTWNFNPLQRLRRANSLAISNPGAADLRSGMRVMKRARAARVVFFYPGEEGTYIDQPMVTLYENGIIHIVASHEETTAHLQNCEILWRITADLEAGDRSGKVKMLRPTQREASPDSPPLS